MKNLVSIIETILVRNNLQSDKFKSVFDEIYHNVTIFSNQFMDIGETKINRIETDMASIKYNRKTDIKSTLFGFIELLDDFGIYLNKEKYKAILNTRDEINNNLQHFIMLFNDITYLEGSVGKFV